MKVEKIGTNQVKVTYSKTVKDTSGKNVEIDGDVVEYGRSKIEGDKAIVQAQITAWSRPTAVTEHLANLNAKLAELNQIEQTLNQ